ncbi:MAG: hypothetical protein IPP89_15840 [Saprospiraceae bacterium]|nr:hypothetical protein [Candidatus Brachybacter algidus]MBL0120404.1 hypothetical protein [Candidatus Brachybacter algidus]
MDWPQGLIDALFLINSNTAEGFAVGLPEKEYSTLKLPLISSFEMETIGNFKT